MENRTSYDVVVIGSGFGGAVTACRAAEAGRSVLVLERGAAYRPGRFARTPLEMSTNVWDPSEGLFGLFQLWSFRHLDAVVASGLGGGSLIYANVMLRMPEPWFEASRHLWPLEYSDIADHYDTVEKMLGANPLPRHLLERVPKVKVFELAAKEARLPPQAAQLAVTFADEGREPGEVFGDPEENLHGFQRRTCQLCGQCDVGCNDGAKNTLDLTYLSQAKAAGAEIAPLHEVKRITAVPMGEDEEYDIHYVVHEPPDPPWDRTRRATGQRQKLESVRARTVVLAAGAFGSTRLLLANRAGLPRLSGQLGTRFSGNGDALGFVTGGDHRVDSQSGPVITSYAESEDGRHFVQDGGYPVLMGWLGEALQPGLAVRAARLGVTRWWERKRGRADSNVGANLSRLLGSVGVSRTTMPLLAMGLDPSSGTMRLTGSRLDLDWSAQRSGDYFDRIWQTMATMARVSGARFRRGPSALLSRNVSAHPLGGCPMGTDRAHGVVDSHGRAFGHPGLFVVDGSVMPGPVGANPSLTIAALAERFAMTIVKEG